MHVKPSRRRENTDATRRALTRVAREQFTRYGYAGAKTEGIVKRARVTRGALYHHFPAGKKELFRAVFEEVEQQILERVAMTSMESSDIWSKAVGGLRAFLDACMEPAVQRIVLLDAPSVLGWDVWHQIDERYGFGIMRGMLEAAMTEGVIRTQPLDALAHVMLGALNEGALLIARSEDPEATRRDVEASLLGLMEGMRV
ncbi:MAG: TetR/AcrR family transcriptional regulator [Actinomycetota bacterium]